MTSSRESGKHLLARGSHLRLVSSDGWEYVERTGTTGVVAIVAVDGGKLVLTEQYRAPVAARVIDLPAGLAGDGPSGAAEGLIAAAKRELLEEAGFEAAEMTYLTHGPSSAGLTAEIVTFYLASGLKRVGPGGGDDSEEIQVHLIPLSTIDDWLRQRSEAGAYVDPKVYVGLYFLRRKGIGPG